MVGSQGLATEGTELIGSNVPWRERIGWQEEWKWHWINSKLNQRGRQKLPVILGLVALETLTKGSADNQEVKVQWVTVEPCCVEESSLPENKAQIYKLN